MVEDKEEAFNGYIYKSLNTINEKVYIGKTGKTIEERWSRHLEDARALKRAREANPDKNIEGSHLNNAINKYGSDAFIVNQVDVAYSREELNEKERYWVKEYDSMNPDKGYNMTEGGEGGRQSPEVIEKMTEISKERAKNPDWLQKMTEINQEIARNPQTLEKMSSVMTEKWQEPKYQESVSKGVTEKWKDEKYRERQARARTEGKREIPDKAEFLKDITEMKKKDINTKYDMDGKSINKRIEEMLKHQDVRTYSEAKKYLEDKNLNEVLKDIEKRQEMVKKPDFKEKMTEINRERAKDPEWVKKMTEINRARAKDPQWIEKMREIGKQYRKEIPDKREFLNEIKGDMLKKDMLKKYDMGKNSFNKRIQEMFGPDGPRNYTELKNYMQDKNVDDVLKEIEERNNEREIKPESQGDELKDKGDSKSQDNSKEKTDKDTKSDEKEDSKEPSKEENEENKSDKNKENSERNQNHENSDENLREKKEKSAEIDENIESKNKETMDEDTSKEEKENNVKDSEESKSKDSSNSEEEAKFGKNVEGMENLNLTVKDYAGIDKNSSEREQDITCLDEVQDSKNSGSTKYIDLGNEDIKSIVIVKDIKTDENKDYTGVDEGSKKELPDYAFIDNFLDKTKEIEESKSDKRNERGKEYRHT